MKLSGLEQVTVEIKIGSMKYLCKDNAISLAQSKEDLEELIIKVEKMKNLG